MAIQFNEIPLNIRTPGVFIEIDNSQAVQGVSTSPHRILAIGQRLSTGTLQPLQPTRITSAAEAESAFGKGSMLAGIFAALKRVTPHIESWGIALDDAESGAKAAGKITATGTATEAGIIALYIAGERIRVGVKKGDTQDALAAAVVKAVNAAPGLPVVASITGDTSSKEATLTCRWAGETGNEIDLRHSYHASGSAERLPSGVGIAITPMASGSGNPDIATALAAMGDAQYKTIIMPYTDASNLAALEEELATRWGPMVMREGHAFAAKSGKLSALSALGESRNSPHLSIIGAGASPSAPWAWAAAVAGMDSAEPDPARPRQTLPLRGLLPSAEGAQLTQSERNLLLFDGISTHYVDDGGVVRIERLITTYKTNAASAPDASYLDVTTMRTLAFLRETQRNRILLKFPRHKLANDGTLFGPGQAVVTPKIIRAELVALWREWEQMGLVEGFEQFKADLQVERDATDANRVNVLTAPDIINQMRMLAGSVQFRL